MSNEIKPEKRKIVNEKTLLVTVDIGKVTNMGYYRCPDGTESKPFEFFNTGQGFNKFWRRISAASHNHNLRDIVVGFEPTGSYAEPLVHYLRKREVKLVQINPSHSKKVKELQGNSPNKTDKKDPKVIADVIELGHALTVVVPEGAAAELRRLIHARDRRVETRTGMWNQLHAQVVVIFPEFLNVIKNITGMTARYLLKNYPMPQDIVDLGLEELALIMKRESRGQFGRQRAEDLYEAARSSIGIHEGEASIILEIRHILTAIETFDKFILETEQRLPEYLKQIPYSKFMLSITGIGELTVAGLIGEVGDFRKFKTLSEIHKLADLDLYEISSGKHRGKKRISKRGRALMRKILYFAAINVIRKGRILHEKYQSYIQRGMVKMKALTAIARKLLGIICALIRHDSDYIVDYQQQQRRQNVLKLNFV